MAPSKFATAATVTASSIKHTTPSDGIRAFFFDLDNTLIPTRAGDSKAVRKVSKIRTYARTVYSLGDCVWWKLPVRVKVRAASC